MLTVVLFCVYSNKDYSPHYIVQLTDKKFQDEIAYKSVSIWS